MSETPLTDAEVEALWGTTDAANGFEHPQPSADYRYKGTRNNALLLLMAALADSLRVFQDGTLTFGVKPGRFANGDTMVTYVGASAQSLTNNATNYIYLIADGTLTVNTTGFPTPSVTPYIPLATIETAGGTYARSDIIDMRTPAVFHLLS